jgi:superfamily II DNA or RNA helicase
VDLIGEGVDVPACQGVQLLRKTQSQALYLQMAARGLTPVYENVKSEDNPTGFNIENIKERQKSLQAGKPTALILDHAGNYYNHGSILKIRDWSIDHKKRDSRKKNIIEVLECPCGLTWSKGTKECPVCGHSFEREAAERKAFEMHELEEDLINIDSIEKRDVKVLMETLERIKRCDNKVNGLYREMHKSINIGEGNLYAKLEGLTKGLGYQRKYKHTVWKFLSKRYGAKLEALK